MSAVSAPLFVFVDPAAGHQGVHNLGFVDVLLHHASKSTLQMALASHQKLKQDYCEQLQKSGVAVFNVFKTNAYRFNNKQPSVAELLPYTMQLAVEYQELMQQVAQRWPERKICWIFHTSPWQHLQALPVAINKLSSRLIKNWQFHIYLMYWHGMDSHGVVKDAILRMRFHLTLNRLSLCPNVYYFTSTPVYLKGYQALLKTTQHTVGLHPFFLGNWQEQPRRQTQPLPLKVRRVLAYSGDARDIKGFQKLPPCLRAVFDQFKQVQQVIVHLTRIPGSTTARTDIVWEQLQGLAQQDRCLRLQKGFLSHQSLLNLLVQVDLLVLNYDSEAYKYKTSGFIWLAAQLGLTCAVTADTWLEHEAVRLGIHGWRICSNGDWKVLPSLPEAEILTNRQSILQPFESWLLKYSPVSGS